MAITCRSTSISSTPPRSPIGLPIVQWAAILARFSWRPPVWWGTSPHHLAYPGTISLSMKTMSDLLVDIIRSLLRHGFYRFLFLNGHGGNGGVLSATALRISEELGVSPAVASYWTLIPEVMREIGETKRGGMGHACEMETSLQLYLRKDDGVDMKQAPKDMPRELTSFSHIDFREPGPVMIPWDFARDSRTGTMGDATVATYEKGRRIGEAAIDRVYDLCRELLQLDADDLKSGTLRGAGKRLDRMTEPILAAEDIDVVISGRAVLQQISLSIAAGESVALIGESGSGKSMFARTVLGLLPRGAKARGRLRFEGREVLGASDRTYRGLRGARIGYVPQDPAAAFNPTLRVADQIAEPLTFHPAQAAAAHAPTPLEMMRSVGLSDPERRARQYPHEMSGGMLQRTLIASAVSLGPGLLIADEPTTGLDVTTQADIMELIRSLQARSNMALLLISHDLALVSTMLRAYRRSLPRRDRGGRRNITGGRESAARLFTCPSRGNTDSGSCSPGMSTETLLEVIGLSKTFTTTSLLGRRTETPALRNVSLRVRARRFVGSCRGIGFGQIYFGALHPRSRTS